jgi:hypothetical protein
MRKKKMVRQRKALIKELGFFTLAKCALFISTYYWASGAARPKVYFWVFIVQIVQRNYHIKEKDAYKKKEKRVGNKKISVKKYKFTSSSTRGLAT